MARAAGPELADRRWMRSLAFGLALMFLPLFACIADDGLATPQPIASIAGPRALITAGNRAFIAADDGLYAVPLDGGSPTRSAPASGALALEPDGNTLDIAELPTGITALDTRDLAARPRAGDVAGVQVMAASQHDLYWIDAYLDTDHSPHNELRALDLRTGAVRVVASALPIDDTYQSNRLGLVADDAAAYVRTNRTLARYDRVTGELRVLASRLGVASDLAIEGGELYLVDGNVATRVSIADGTLHALGHVRGDVEGIVVEGGVATIATSESNCGFVDNCDPDDRTGWLSEVDDSGVERVLAYRPTARIVGLALIPGAVLFVERPSTGGLGGVLSIPR
jgi:hypothetical protein